MSRSTKAKLTLKAIDAIAPDIGGDRLMWDTLVPGFGLRIKPSGTRSFVLAYRNRYGRSRWYTIAKLGVMTPDQARVVARSLLAEVAKGGDPAEDRAGDRAAITVEALCIDYLDKARRGVLLTRRGKPKKERTLYIDEGRLKRHLIPRLGARPIKDISTADIRRLMHDVTEGKTAADIKTDKKRGRSIVRGGAGTASRLVGLLGGVFQYAVDHGLLPSNPVRGVVRPGDKRRQVALSREQYRLLGRALEAAEGRGDSQVAVDAVRLIAVTGARLGEVLNLRWSEVDIAGRCLRLSDTKTGASLRPLGVAAAELLARRRLTAVGPFVFPGGLPESPYGGTARAWARIIPPELAGLTVHGLRHAFAGTSDELGLSLPTIGALLGHTTRVGGVTGGYVAKTDPTLLAAADRVCGWIDGALWGEFGSVISIGDIRRA